MSPSGLRQNHTGCSRLFWSATVRPGYSRVRQTSLTVSDGSLTHARPARACSGLETALY